MSRKLHDQLKYEKSSYNRRCEITKSEEDSPLKSYWSHHKQGNFGKVSEEDEVVKYMSNLPGYLERGEKNREQVLNVGVLDWTRLERWQYSHKHVPHRSSRSSTCSNASSSVSTNELSGRSSKVHSRPSGQRTNHASLQSHFMASPMQGPSQAVKSSRESMGNCQKVWEIVRGSHSNIDTHSKYLKTNEYFPHNNPSNNRLKGCNRKSLGQYVDNGSDIFPNDRMNEPTSCGRMGICAQDGGLEKRVETLRRPNIDAVVQSALRKSDPAVLYLPRDNSQNIHCRVPDVRTSLDQKTEYYSRMSFSEKPKELHHRDLDYDIPYSCHLPDELGCSYSQCEGSVPSSTDLESIRVPASTFSSPLSTFSSPMSVKMRLSPSRFRKSEEKKPTIGTTSYAKGPLQGSEPKVTSEKSRSSSPFRRLSISLGYSSKGSASKEGGNVPHSSYTPALKSNSEFVRGYASSNSSDTVKPGDTARRRSSPLRRLLDPLLKPKTEKSHHSVESSRKDSMLINKNCNSVNEKFSSQKPDKEGERDHKVGCSSVNAVDSSKDKKHASSVTQAILRVAVRNGMPLFTFAVDNTESNILAATVKSLSTSGKDECNCIYTFYTFREAKKKTGSWMNQAGRSKGPGYVPHAVAQMKASDLHYYDFTAQNSVDFSTMKEFVLNSVKLEQGDAHATEYQPNDELAAVVVKIPKATSFIDDRHQNGYQSDSQGPAHATVLLPSGVHSLPSKGGPSSLIERWKTGGSCDCGGWDLACNLKVLSNENHASRKPRPSKAYVADQIELFLQGNEQEHRAVFSVTPFRHGMYSITFDSSLSQLQAFSISIALVDSEIPYELSGSRSSIEGKNPRETLLVQSEELNSFGKLEDIPASYVSYPPHSPVGRV